jgi:tetratricopeptide (TPR) repeat protein
MILNRTYPVSLIACVVLLQLWLSGCAASRQRSDRPSVLYEFSRAPLLGMIYDYDNKPCSNSLVTVDGQEGPRSDINGRFITKPLSKGEHRITIEKEGYEPVPIVFQFLNRNQVLYVRMISFNQLLKELESAIEGGRWDEAHKLIERAEKIKRDDTVENYLKAMFFKERGFFEDAIEVLNGIIAMGFREPHVYLSLADIYQYQLNDAAHASKYLEEFLKSKRSREVEKRLESLKSETK